MKNPNGYGSVFKLAGNRRRPWCARVTVGWSDDGKQKFKNIGYFEERSEAMIALAQYNNDPYEDSIYHISPNVNQNRIRVYYKCII